MTEGGMTDIVSQRDGFDQILVEMKIAADSPGDSGDELDMQNPMSDMVVSDQAEDLGLVDIAGVGSRVQNAVGILGEVLPVSMQFLMASSDSCSRADGLRGKVRCLALVQVVGYGKLGKLIGGFTHRTSISAGYSHSAPYNNARHIM